MIAACGFGELHRLGRWPVGKVYQTVTLHKLSNEGSMQAWRTNPVMLFLLMASAMCIAQDAAQTPNCVNRSARLDKLPCPATQPSTTTTDSGSSTPSPTAQQIKQAEDDFQRALRLENDKNFEDSFQELDAALALNPANLKYLATQEYVRQELVSR